MSPPKTARLLLTIGSGLPTHGTVAQMIGTISRPRARRRLTTGRMPSKPWWLPPMSAIDAQKSVTVERKNATEPPRGDPSRPRRRRPRWIVGGQPWTASRPVSIAMAVPVTVPNSSGCPGDPGNDRWATTHSCRYRPFGRSFACRDRLGTRRGAPGLTLPLRGLVARLIADLLSCAHRRRAALVTGNWRDALLFGDFSCGESLMPLYRLSPRVDRTLGPDGGVRRPPQNPSRRISLMLGRRGP